MGSNHDTSLCPSMTLRRSDPLIPKSMNRRKKTSSPFMESTFILCPAHLRHVMSVMGLLCSRLRLNKQWPYDHSPRSHISGHRRITSFTQIIMKPLLHPQGEHSPRIIRTQMREERWGESQNRESEAPPQGQADQEPPSLQNFLQEEVDAKAVLKGSSRESLGERRQEPQPPWAPASHSTAYTGAR